MNALASAACRRGLQSAAVQPCSCSYSAALPGPVSRARDRAGAPTIQCSMGGASSSGPSDGGPTGGKGSGGGKARGVGGKGSGRKARAPGIYEVKVVTPPPCSLGIYALPPNTHNGEEIEIDGQNYVVTTVVLKYKLLAGKYVRDHNRLEVQPTGRYFLNMMLDNLVKGRYVGPTETGQQD